MDTGQEEDGICSQVQGQARSHQIKFTSFLLRIRIETFFERDQRMFLDAMTSNPTSDPTSDIRSGVAEKSISQS